MRRFCLMLLVCGLSPVCLAQLDILDMLATKEGMTGTFEQQIISPEGEPLETSNGQFSLLRPDSMRWEIESPDRQLLIASGQQLTQIDWDLEMVIERRLADRDPSILDWLLASEKELEAAFVIEALEATVVLTPREPSLTLTRLEIARATPQIWEIAVTDSTAQVLKISLFEDPDRAPSASDFVAPATDF